jgi:hypothetical protein
MIKFKKKFTVVIIIIAVASMCSCASVQTAMDHRNLEASSKMSETIFLDPVPNNQKKVFVSIKNTSDKPLSITNQVKSAIESNGYKVVSNPNNAHYFLQANILKIGKMSQSAAQSALGGGYGSAIAGTATGVALGSLTDNTNAMVGAGLAGGLISMAADNLVKDINYSMITDIQISERTRELVDENSQSHLKNGSSSHTVQKSNKRTHFKRYRTRVVSNADKVNLKFAEAKPALEQGLAKVISGIF